jgi:predicted RNA-binding Zn ribbon-like protein
MPTPAPTIPPGLELVRGFDNPLDLEAGVDLLAPWLSDWGVTPTAVALERAGALREALRTLLLANTGTRVATAAAEDVVDAAARRARLSVRFVQRTAVLAPSGRGLDVVLGELLAHVATAMRDGTWPRLKVCVNQDCRWAFWDRARNRSRRWCSMAECGNVMKARAYRRRHA